MVLWQGQRCPLCGLKRASQRRDDGEARSESLMAGSTEPTIVHRVGGKVLF